MTDTADTAAAYDAVAVRYAELFSDVLATLPLERALLAAFAELVLAHDAGPVADIGCGPGHVTAHVRALGLDAFGIDVSAEMVALARAAQPHVRFDVGSMLELDLADGSLGGVLALFSTIHLPPRQLPMAFEEFYRVLSPGGHLLLGFLAGDDPLPREVDHRVAPAHEWSPGVLADLLGRNGFAEAGRLTREPHEGERFRSGLLLARRQA
ncbi:class I SAM-dependent methyltransferase [Nocardia sp. NRRL S-836]|uniref:class I SAM-dependent methyltransferase n=1 Tax=Nocardia sp. NRRL S-836 TaxID=1519492 RepID=UPI0006ADBD94|nr:class I SAM-dependent methyltransferase [Nocardia sp. NRRL S-836]